MRSPKEKAHYAGVNKKHRIIPCPRHVSVSSSVTLNLLTKEKEGSHTATGDRDSLSLSLPPVSLRAPWPEEKPIFGLPCVLLALVYL